MTATTGLPVVTGVLGTADHPRGLALKCGLEGGETLLFAIDEAAVSAFLAAITERSLIQGRLQPGQTILANPLRVEAVTVLSAPECETALAFHIRGGWTLTLGLALKAWTDLAEKIALLNAPADGPSAARH